MAYFSGRADVCWMPTEPRTDWPEVVILPNPQWHQGYYCATGALWQRYFRAEHPQTRFLLAGYAAINHTNYLDLLALPTDWVAFYQASLDCQVDWVLPACDGLHLEDKLRRFLAGHGDQSVIAILGRMKLTIAVAQREHRQMNTDYEEVYRAVIQPAALGHKWREWRQRWDFYLPLFRILPFSPLLESLEKDLLVLERWIGQDCKDPAPLREGRLMEALATIQQSLQLIEKTYVGQELQTINR